MKRLIVAAALCTAFGTIPFASRAADLAPLVAPHTKHVSVTRFWTWRDRCAWEGYYCLYAWHGYVYHYPWDELAYAYYPRRQHRR